VAASTERDSGANAALHYSRTRMIPLLREALARAGQDPARLEPRDLRALDQLHLGGWEATERLLELAELRAEDRVLDLGSGLGGPARRVAQAGSRVIGIDLTLDYCVAARQLSEWMGLLERTQFVCGDVCRLPIRSRSVQVVWMQHVNMNVADKLGLAREAARVLTTGGALVMHEVFGGSGGREVLPVPWASDARCSFLCPQAEFRECLEKAGLGVERWEDVTDQSIAWARRSLDRVQAAGSTAPLGPHLVWGEGVTQMLTNLCQNLEEGRATVAIVRAIQPKL